MIFSHSTREGQQEKKKKWEVEGMNKEVIRNVVTMYHSKFRNLIINILKLQTIEEWNETVPVSTIEEVTNIIHDGFAQNGHLRREDDILKLANLYYAGYSRAVLNTDALKAKKVA